MFNLTKLIRNNRGSTAMFLAILVLAAMLVVVISANDIVLNGLKMTKERYDSTKAYFAAEAGAERILWEIRKNGIDPGDGASPTPSGVCPSIDAEFCFAANGDLGSPSCVVNAEPTNCAINKIQLSNGAEYNITYDYVNGVPAVRTFKVLGTIGNVARKIQLRYAY